ncbi:MAG TPA: hypothetical protein VM487_04475 [Phycisphaerae bacterium]|nr:hypothetical protein [Phycisphaerae bacterium]
MNRVDLLSLAVLVAVTQLAGAQVPPGYEIVTIEDDPSTFNYTARMNNRGQIVYSTWFDNGIDIFLYDNGETIRLTDDAAYDRMPDINDMGQIVWSRAVNGAGTAKQIVMWQDGELRQLTFSDLDDLSPRINNLGHVVWKRWKGQGCGDASADIYFYDGQVIRQITSDDWSNQSAVINDYDQIVWTEYNFCDEPWTSRIMMWQDDVTTQLSGDESEAPTGPGINNSGQIAWQTDVPGPNKGIIWWENGDGTLLTDNGGSPEVNEHADVAFHRWYEGDPIGSYEVWLYRNGQFLQITDDPHDQGWNNIWNVPTDINDAGEIAFISGRSWYYKMIVKCMKLRLGSAGVGGKIDAIDVQPINP